MCHGCFTKLNAAHDFLSVLRDSLARLGQCKRAANTSGDTIVDKKRKKEKDKKKTCGKLFSGNITSVPIERQTTPEHGEIFEWQYMDTRTCLPNVLPGISTVNSSALAHQPLPENDPLSIKAAESTTQESSSPCVASQSHLHHHSFWRNSQNEPSPAENEDQGCDKLGLNNPKYYGLKQLTRQEVSSLIKITQMGNVECLINHLMGIPSIIKGLQRKFLEEIQAAATEIASLKKPSVLRSMRSNESLAESQIPPLIFEEMKTR